MKDFHAEIRAFRDVEDFLNRTLLILDLQTTGLTQIVDAMLNKLQSNKEIGMTFTLEEARQTIFTENSGREPTVHTSKSPQIFKPNLQV